MSDPTDWVSSTLWIWTEISVSGERMEEDNNTSHPDLPHPFLYKNGKLWMNTVTLETQACAIRRLGYF